MANRIYRWKKPEVIITLTAGGTLLPNTTYYFFAYLATHYRLWVYKEGHSPISDVVSFTTDTLNLSISVSWKTSGEITAYSDAGSGKTLVSSMGHCLDSGNSITILTGAYAGTHSVTWADYNSFTINVPYSVNEISSWSCSQWNQNNSEGLKCWLGTTNPFNSDGLYVGSYLNRSHTTYTVGYSSNPIIITAPYNKTDANYYNWNYVGLNDKSFRQQHLLGCPICYFDSGTVTFDVIKAEMIAAGILHCNIIAPSTKLVFLTAHLRVTVTTTTVTAFTIVHADVIFDWPTLTLKQGVINAINDNARGWSLLKLDSSAFYGETMDYIPVNSAGKNRYQSGTSGPNFIDSIVTGVDIIAQTLTYNYPSSVGYMENCNLYLSNYFYMVYRTPTAPGNFRTLRNIYLASANTFDFRVYSYDNTNTYAVWQNVDTPRADNLKVITFNNPTYRVRVDFYRKKDIKIVDQTGNIVINADVKIIGSDNVVYNFISNSSGIAGIDIIEQKNDTTYPNSIATLTKNFTITVSKAGYETFTFFSVLARDINTLVTLTPSRPLRTTLRGRRLKVVNPELGTGSNLVEI